MAKRKSVIRKSAGAHARANLRRFGDFVWSIHNPNKKRFGEREKEKARKAISAWEEAHKAGGFGSGLTWPSLWAARCADDELKEWGEKWNGRGFARLMAKVFAGIKSNEKTWGDKGRLGEKELARQGWGLLLRVWGLHDGEVLFLAPRGEKGSELAGLIRTLDANGEEMFVGLRAKGWRLSWRNQMEAADCDWARGGFDDGSAKAKEKALGLGLKTRRGFLIKNGKKSSERVCSGSIMCAEPWRSKGLSRLALLWDDARKEALLEAKDLKFFESFDALKSDIEKDALSEGLAQGSGKKRMGLGRL